MNGPSFQLDGRRNDGFSIHQLSKSSPSQLPPFLFKRTSRQESHVRTNSSNKAPSLSHVPCKFFKQGTCTAGANCIFSHNADPTSETAVCRYYLKGTCKFGTKCALLHTLAVDSRKKGPSRPVFSSSPQYSQFNQFQLRMVPVDDDDDYDDVNDAMLPSSLNDLLTPSELELKRAREQQDLLMEYSSLPLSQHRPPPQWIEEDTRTGSDHDLAFDFDDDVQFFMEDDPAPTNKKQLSTPFIFPSLNAHRS